MSSAAAHSLRLAGVSASVSQLSLKLADETNLVLSEVEESLASLQITDQVVLDKIQVVKNQVKESNSVLKTNKVCSFSFCFSTIRTG